MPIVDRQAGQVASGSGDDDALAGQRVHFFQAVFIGQAHHDGVRAGCLGGVGAADEPDRDRIRTSIHRGETEHAASWSWVPQTLARRHTWPRNWGDFWPLVGHSHGS